MPRRIAQVAVAAIALPLLAFAVHCDAAWCERHVFLPQQFFLVARPGIVPVARTLAGALGLLLLLLVPFLPAGARGRRVLVALVLALIAAEGLLRWRMRRLLRPELDAAMQALTQPHPRYGLTFAPNLDRTVRVAGRDIGFRTDDKSRRFGGAAPDGARPALVFTGESAMAGMGLQWEESFPAILGSRLQLEVVDLASPAYRIDQSALRLKDALSELARPVAVIGIFMPGLIGRSLPPRSTWLRHSGFYQLWKHLYWSDAAIGEGIRSVRSSLHEMAAQAKARGAPCLFLVTGKTPGWMLRELFGDLDAVVVELPEEELLADGHPGPRASVRIADALEKRLRSSLAHRSRFGDTLLNSTSRGGDSGSGVK